MKIIFSSFFQQDDRFRTIRQGTTLEILNIVKTDAGQYSCDPDDEQSAISIKFTVKVVGMIF